MLNHVVILFDLFCEALLVTIDGFKSYLSIYPVQLGIFVFQGTAGSPFNLECHRLCIPRNRRSPVQPGMSLIVHSKEPQAYLIFQILTTKRSQFKCDPYQSLTSSRI